MDRSTKSNQLASTAGELAPHGSAFLLSSDLPGHRKAAASQVQCYRGFQEET